MSEKMTVLLTGGTGFLGEYLMAELLERGHVVWAHYRSESRKLDTIRFLSSIGLPRSADSLKWFKGGLLEADDQWEQWKKLYDGIDDVDTLIHSAASTRLHMDETGEPLRTNIGSTQTLKRLVDKKPLRVHLISTAYVCGLIQGERVFEANHPRGDFVNVYEESKWEAEQIWGGNATMLRPSIIVGHSETGRCTSFSGWYILFQAAHLMSRLMNDNPDFSRANLNIDIPANPDGVSNVIPVDYVAKASIRLIEDPLNHNKIFHLTHPNPPTHQWTLDHISERFGLGGMRFSGAGAPFTQPRNQIERMVWRQMQTILLHFANNPIFDRTEIDKALPHPQPTDISHEYVDKIIDYAIQSDWGQTLP